MPAIYTCGRCGKPVQKSASVCPHCGVILSGVRCQSCGFVGSREKFVGDRCPQCRSTVRISRAPSRPARSGKSARSSGCSVVLALSAVAVVVILALIFIGPGLGNLLEETAARLSGDDEPAGEMISGGDGEEIAEPTAAVEPTASKGFYEQALAGAFKGKRVVVLTADRDTDASLAQEAFASFERATGIRMSVTSTDDFEPVLEAMLAGGDPPDIAGIPKVALVRRLADEGHLVDVADALNAAWLEENYQPSWLEMATVPGEPGEIMAGVWHRYNLLSLVFYPKDDFKRAGYRVPNTWEDLMALSDQIVADGGTPWCIGVESGSATGWSAVNWLQAILLRTSPPSDCDCWATGELAFDSPQLARSLDLMSDLWFAKGYVHGGREAITTISFVDSPQPMFDTRPGCWLHLQGSFATNYFPENAAYGETYDWFPLPEIDPDYGTPAMVSAMLMVMFEDRPEVAAVMEYLSRGESVRDWVLSGQALSPHKDTPLAWYEDPFIRSQAEHVAGASTIRLDVMNVMPEEVDRQTLWRFLTQYVEGAVGSETVLAMLDDPEHAATPVPTATNTPRPTSTPRPTPTPVATKTPAPTNTPAPPPPPTQPPAPDAVVSAAGLSLTGGPGGGYAVVGGLSQGEGLRVIGQYGGCSWLKVVSSGGVTGWVPGGSGNIQLSVDCSVLPAGTFRPFTGLIQPNTRGGGEGELTVSNGTSTDGLVVLAYSEQPVASAYIRTGESYHFGGISDGVYYLYFSTGSEWNGERFTVNPSYKRFDDAFPFETTATTYTGWSVTLHGVVGGTASASNVNPADFPGMGD